MANPKDPDSLSLAGSSTASGKADFSNVKGGSDTVPDTSGGSGGGKADFSNVQGGSDTVADTGGGGGAGQQSYVVEKGDNLSVISKRFYGKSKFWKQIFDANRDTIENPDLIYPGQTIVLPAIDTDGDGDSGN